MKNFIKYMITAMAAMAAIVPCAAQDADDDGLTIMLTGASFAVRSIRLKNWKIPTYW